MAKSTKKTGGEKTSPVLVYGPTQEAKRRPIRKRLPSGEWIGIGAEITIPAKPPQFPIPRVIREATPEEYEQFKHLKHLVKNV